jgi:Fe-Mn family superoxide dismutase
MKHELPELPYDYDALEPHYDAETLQLHHGKHHQGYVKGLNAALEGLAECRESGDFSRIKPLQRQLAFHGSGHLLHSIFWTNLTPDGGGRPEGRLAHAIDTQLGGFDGFDCAFRAATTAVEGSGWGVLAVDPVSCGLAILQVEKHQNQLLPGWVPLLVVDVWEHAYYLKYQNRRAAFVDAVMDHLVNWRDVATRYERMVST